MAAAAADSSRASDVRPAGVAAAVVTCLVAAVVAVALPFVGVPLAAAALASLVYRGRPLLAIAVAVAAGAATAVLVPSSSSVASVIGAVHLAAWLLVVGPLGAALLRRWRITNVVIAVAGLSIVLMVGLIGATSALTGVSTTESVRAQVRAVMEPIVTQALAGDRDPAELKAELDDLVDAAVRAWPSAIAVETGFTALLAVGAAAFVALRRRVPIGSVPKLEEIDVSPHVVWGLIVGVALLAADVFTGTWNGGMLGIAGENLLRVTEWILFLQGVAIFASWYRRAGFGRGARILGFVVLGITEALVPLVSMTGLVDLWLNFRKLPRDGEPRRRGEVEQPTT